MDGADGLAGRHGRDRVRHARARRRIARAPPTSRCSRARSRAASARLPRLQLPAGLASSWATRGPCRSASSPGRSAGTGMARGLWPAWFPVLVFSPFVVDATVTLAAPPARARARVEGAPQPLLPAPRAGRMEPPPARTRAVGAHGGRGRQRARRPGRDRRCCKALYSRRGCWLMARSVSRSIAGTREAPASSGAALRDTEPQKNNRAPRTAADGPPAGPRHEALPTGFPGRRRLGARRRRARRELGVRLRAAARQRARRRQRATSRSPSRWPCRCRRS